MSAGVCLAKPSLRELRMLTGRELSSDDEQAQAARDLVERGSAEIVALSLGKDGALLVTRDETPSVCRFHDDRSEEHTSELQSLMRISYAVFCLKKKTYITNYNQKHTS